MEFIGRHHVANALWPKATYWNTGTPNSSSGFDMGRYGHACFILQQGVGTAGSATITMEACTDTAGTSPTAIAFKYRLSTTQDTWGALTDCANTGIVFGAASGQMLAIEVDAEDLTAAKPFLRLTATVSDVTAVQASGIVILAEAAYPKAIPLTALV